MKVVNKYNHTPCGDDVNVMRPHLLSNQWSHMAGTYAKYAVSTREIAVEEYEKWLRASVAAKDPSVMRALGQLNKDSVLVCCCKPLRCHGDVIQTVWEEINKETKLEETKVKYYAGVGSRSTPYRMCHFMTQVASWMQEKGWTLRSGGADGADTAFERGVTGTNKQIFLPWSGFNKNRSNLYTMPREAFQTVDQFHPAPHRLSPAGRKMMARNACQVLGPDLNTYSRTVLCWTPGGLGDGGTGQAIRIARHYEISVHDLGKAAELDHISNITGIQY